MRPLLRSICICVSAVLAACGSNEQSSTSLTTAARSAQHSVAFTPEMVGEINGHRTDYAITKTATGYAVTHITGNEPIKVFPNTIQTIRFNDMSVNLAIGAKAASIAPAHLQSLIELYIAYFNRVPDADGLAFWIDQFNSGRAVDEIGQSFYDAAVQFSPITGYSTSLANIDFVKIVYKNVLGRDTPDESGLNYWTSALSAGAETRGTLIKSMLNSAHTFKGDLNYGWVADLLDNRIRLAMLFTVQQGLNYNSAEESIKNTMALTAAVTPDGLNNALAIIGDLDWPFTQLATKIALRETATFGNPIGWFHTYQVDDSGTETLVLSTIDGPNIYNVSPGTPIHILSASSNGVFDVTTQYFATPPTTFWARNLVSFKDDAGKLNLWICSQGREIGGPDGYAAASTPRINGQWGEQDQLFVLENGKFVNKSSVLPQVVDFTHGCAVARTGDGRVNLVKNTLGDFGSYVNRNLFIWDGSKYVLNPEFNRGQVDSPETGGSFQVTAADFTKTGKDDIVFGKALLRRINGAYTTVQQLRAPDLEATGYGTAHGNTVGDLNGDGYPDLVLLFSGDGTKNISNLAGVRLAAFINDKTGRLVYTPNVFPAHLDTDFGLDVRVLDINFDGKADIVTSGERYVYSNTSNVTDYTVSAVMLNKGDGTFEKRALSDPELSGQCSQECQTATYFLKNADGSFSIIARGRDAKRNTIHYGRKVRQSAPLLLQ